jgi:CheY-like chemotaxis protein
LARKILLADDSVTAQNMGRRILTDAGYEVTTVNNGSAALKKIAELSPDLIVLDVYMPGYGGLEVCQRIKESQATSRIPVLITVGKLEPFKAEEARRVRADGHLVKPFDPTELLAAIMRLEDRIVPQPVAGKLGRSAKATAAGEESSSRRGRDKSVDPTTETSSWKKRLSIPRPTPSPEVQKDSEPQSAGTAFQDLTRGENSKPQEARLPEFPIPSSSSPAVAPAAPEKSAASPVSSSASTESAASQEARPDGDAKLDSVIPKTPANVEALTLAPVVSAEVPHSKQSPSGAEVMAALASLSPATGDVPENSTQAAAAIEVSSHGYTETDLAKSGDTTRDNAFSALGAALAAVSTVLAGPRWTAERVPLSDGDSHLILEAEMERAYAAFAAAESARTAPSVFDPETNPAAPEIPILTDSQNSAQPDVAPVPAQETVVATPEVGEEQASGTSDIRGPDVPSHGEPAPSPIADLGAEAISDAVASSVVQPGAVNTENAGNVIPEPVASTEYRDLACAAAASAGSGPMETNRAAFIPSAGDWSENRGNQAETGAGHDPTVQPDVAVEATSQSAPDSAIDAAHEAASLTVEAPALEPGDPERESQLVAAWQNWRQIRESIIGEQIPSQIADAAATEFKQIRAEEKEQKADATETDAESLSRAVAEASAIAGIVDSVLSELKPKLMEEIARKLAADRK